MKYRRTAVILACIGSIGVTAAMSSAQTRTDPPDNAARAVRQDLKRTQADMDRLRRDMDNQARSLRASASTLRHADLLRTGAGLMRGAVLTRQPVPKIAPPLKPLARPARVRPFIPPQTATLQLRDLVGVATLTGGFGGNVTCVVPDLRSAYLVGTGRATPSLLRPIVPHVTLACDRLATPIDWRGLGNLESTTPIGHSEPGVSHRITHLSTNTSRRTDPLTNQIITTHRTYCTSEFRMNGQQWNQWYRTQIMRPPTVQPLPRFQTMPRMNTYTPPMNTYTPPMQTYTQPMRTYSPPPRIP